jgi:hypothetical protein
MEEDMNEFFDEFVTEVTKIEEFYQRKVKHYTDEFYLLRDAFRKYNNHEHKSKRLAMNNTRKISPIMPLIPTRANKA